MNTHLTILFCKGHSEGIMIMVHSNSSTHNTVTINWRTCSTTRHIWSKNVHYTRYRYIYLCNILKKKLLLRVVLLHNTFYFYLSRFVICVTISSTREMSSSCDKKLNMCLCFNLLFCKDVTYFYSLIYYLKFRICTFLIYFFCLIT